VEKAVLDLSQAQAKPYASGLPSKLPEGLAQEGDIMGDLLANRSRNIKKILNYRLPQDKYHVPCTTTQDIGWPWIKDKPREHLEIFGCQARGKRDINKIICGGYDKFK
jgi:hypothetical protein